MAELKLKISEDIKRKLKKYPGIKLSEVVERALRKELEEREKARLLLIALNKVLKGSKLTESDALKLGEKIKEGMWKRYQAEGW
jgi:hypothetical protein